MFNRFDFYISPVYSFSPPALKTVMVLLCRALIFFLRERRLCWYDVSCAASIFSTCRSEFTRSWVDGHTCRRHDISLCFTKIFTNAPKVYSQGHHADRSMENAFGETASLAC